MPTDNHPKSRATNVKDEIWKDQIRREVEESQNVQAPPAPMHRVALVAPRVTKSYYDRLKFEEQQLRKEEFLRQNRSKSESAIMKAMQKRSREESERNRRGKGGNVVGTGEHSSWPHGHKRNKGRHGGKSDGSELSGEDADGENRDGTATTGDESAAEEILSYFDPNFVKPEFKPLLGQSRNIVVGPPKEILRKYFGYKTDEQIPEELQHDDSPKAFILPKRYWKDYEDAELPTERSSFHFFKDMATNEAAAAATEEHAPQFVPDAELLKRMQEEKGLEPYIPRQPKNYAVDYLARSSFKKYGMVGSNLNDASPGVLDHWEMKPVNADPGGHLRRNITDKRFKISEVTDTPVKASQKESKLKDRPWYADEFAEDVDPKDLDKNPTMDGTSSRTGKGDGKDPKGKHGGRGKKGRRRYSPGSDTSGSTSSSSSSCSCMDHSSSSSPVSDKEPKTEDDKGDPSLKTSKTKMRKGKGKKDKSGTDDDDEIPEWAKPVEQWKPPPGHKTWIHKSLRKVESAPENLFHGDDDIKPKDWIDAFGKVKRQRELEDEYGIGDKDEDDEIDQPAGDDVGGSEEEEEEEDPMERLPRDSDLNTKSSRRRFPQYPPPEQFKYYKSYPLYPTISSERYYEWFSDVNRLKNPLLKKKWLRPGISKSAGSINWDDPKEASKWYSYGYRRPDTKPKPQRQDYDTKDYVYDNARSIMLMPPKKGIPRYVDDRKGTCRLLEPSGLVHKFVYKEEYGKIPHYLTIRNAEQGRPELPDMDKFYRPHRCKFLHGHIHCKLCMRAHPTIRHRRIDWNCEMTPDDFVDALEYRKSRRSLQQRSSMLGRGGTNYYQQNSDEDESHLQPRLHIVNRGTGFLTDESYAGTSGQGQYTLESGESQNLYPFESSTELMITDSNASSGASINRPRYYV